jgi:hypothetical protein
VKEIEGVEDRFMKEDIKVNEINDRENKVKDVASELMISQRITRIYLKWINY